MSPRRAGLADSGTMSMALLVTVVGVLISAVLAAMVSVQIGASRRAVQSGHALDAAQAGLDVVVGHIRHAVDGAGSDSRSSSAASVMTSAAPEDAIMCSNR